VSAEPTRAIVLRTVEFSETSLIVTLLTRDFGRLSAMAKGARRPKGPFEGSLDLLSVCRVLVIRKRADTLDLLTEAKLVRRFRGAERSLERTYAGYYVAEMLRLLTDDHDPQSDLYDLTIRTLQQIDGSGDVPTSLAYFDAQALRICGHSPGTHRCTVCGGAVEPGVRTAFSFESGVVCRRCRIGRGPVGWVRAEVIGAFRDLQHKGLELPVELDASIYGEFRAVMNRYIQCLLGTTPRMQSYLPTALRTETTA
jgi:DNA repair protein RecO (recombination protein O)